MKTLAVLFAVSILVAALPAQATPADRKELTKREAAAGHDPESLMKVGDWARSRGLADDAKRIFEAILKAKPDHEGANRALGRELVDSVWMSADDAAAARKRARAAELAQKGLVEVDGVAVPEAQAKDAREGIFHFDGKLVTKEEFVAFSAGKVRHPVTGEPIEAANLEQAKRRLFPVGKDVRWVDETEADKYHADSDRPWMLRTGDYVLVSTLPIAQLEAMKEHADRTVRIVRPILGFAESRPANRPVILIAADDVEYRTMGQSMGDASSAFGAFLANDRAHIDVPFHGGVRPSVCLWDEHWGPYNLPHAVGLALANALLDELDSEAPSWFMAALASYASRFESPPTGAWFAQRLAKGSGLKPAGEWMTSFAITGGMDFNAIDGTVTEAGLLIAFCVDGKNDAATKALEGVSAAFKARKASAIDSAIKSLQAALTAQSAAIGDYLVKLVNQRG